MRLTIDSKRDEDVVLTESIHLGQAAALEDADSELTLRLRLGLGLGLRLDHRLRFQFRFRLGLGLGLGGILSISSVVLLFRLHYRQKLVHSHRVVPICIQLLKDVMR